VETRSALNQINIFFSLLRIIGMLLVRILLGIYFVFKIQVLFREVLMHLFDSSDT